ncbi:hypothetical protein FXO38_02361 [Capsicum annuum]|nr:hypothetical protein FXO38_02361 [Capsicum annuum]KAF3682615.1 hypothetical protein FXO37_02241 [Capsicum annuum]
MVKQGKIFDAQLKMFAQQFDPFVDSKIKDVLEAYANIHGCIDDIEHQVNERLGEMIVPNLSRFEVVLGRARANITSLQSRASTSGPPKDMGNVEAIGKYSTPRTIIVTALVEYGTTTDVPTTADTAAYSVLYDTNA